VRSISVGAAFAWFAPLGRSHRIDYIATPSDWGFLRGLGGKCHTLLHEFAGTGQTTAASCLDAEAVGSEGIRAAPGSVRWRPPAVDRDALRDPLRCHVPWPYIA